MDDFLDLINKLELPEKGYNLLEELRKKALIVRMAGKRDIDNLISELSDRIAPVVFTPQVYIELPILYFLRAHCNYVAMELFKSETLGRTKKDIEKAADKFRIYNSEWNESLAHSYLGLLHCRGGDLDLCHKELATSTQILMRLERDLSGTKQYEKLLRIKSQLNQIAEQIKRAGARGHNSGFPGEDVVQRDKALHRSILQKQREQLKQHYNYLQNNQLKVPPTLVASLFYLYKTLAPSHSVYSEIPEPTTDKEKTIYEELLKKIGFFEVIEQLVALERASNPAATREELLEIINLAWDKDIKE